MFASIFRNYKIDTLLHTRAPDTQDTRRFKRILRKLEQKQDHIYDKIILYPPGRLIHICKTQTHHKTPY